MAVRKGTYVLAIKLQTPRTVRAGALGEHVFGPGMYLYAGSAMGGLDQRLSRHLRREKTLRWHIDYLTSVCDSSEAYESYPDFIPECDLARMISECGGVPELKGFGCSDCRCATHLFRADEEVLQNVVARCRLAPFRARELL
jgi:Uri superfamily endonuclease